MYISLFAYFKTFEMIVKLNEIVFSTYNHFLNSTIYRPLYFVAFVIVKTILLKLECLVFCFVACYL